MTNSKTSLFSRLATYLRESKEETKKITWPTRKETIRYSLLTIVITIATAALFAGLDALFNLGLTSLLSAF